MDERHYCDDESKKKKTTKKMKTASLLCEVVLAVLFRAESGSLSSGPFFEP